MKLLALHLTNVRKFTGKRASITGIGDGITVVSEANEFGKSTFFDAIHALFFEKYSSSARAVKSLQPYAGGGVNVAADVETSGGAFRVEKRFLSKKSAKVSRLADGATVAQDDEAERWIAQLLGSASEGPAGLLWVRQGLVGLEPDGNKEKAQLMETRRDLLSSVAGEIDAMTGGRRMDRVMRQVADDLSEIATTKTGAKRGAWKAAFDEVAELSVALDAVQAQVQTLEHALGARKQAEAALRRLDNPEAKARRDDALRDATSAMDAARAHVGRVAAARQDRDLAALKATTAQADLDAFLKVVDTLHAAEKQAALAASQAGAAQAEADRLHKDVREAQTQYEAAVLAVTEARTLLDRARQQVAGQAAQVEAKRLRALIAQAEKALGERDEARAVVSSSDATMEWLARAEEAHRQVLHCTSAIEAQSTTLTMAYDGDVRVLEDGAALPGGEPILLEGARTLDLPGIGRMTLKTAGAGAEAKARLSQARKALTAVLSHAGVDDLKDARTQASLRADAVTKVALTQAIVDTIAPDGLGALLQAKADAELAAAELKDEPSPDLAQLESQLTSAQDGEVAARGRLTGAEQTFALARDANIKIQAQLDSAQQGLERARSEAGPQESRDARRAEKLRTQVLHQEALAQAEAHLQSQITVAPDLGTCQAELQRAEAAAAAAGHERAQVSERLAALSSEIRTLAGNGIEEQRDALAGQLEAARSVEARFARQAAALTRLQTALEAERSAARDTYFGPVQEELKPLLSILHRDAALSFDSTSLLPSGLTRDQGRETLDDLSGGTKEQIAILTRLAFARLFARQGRHMPIVLDDALVYSDDDRIIKMFTALTRVAQDQQILVFSCRQLAFQDLGGARPTVDIHEI